VGAIRKAMRARTRVDRLAVKQQIEVLLLIVMFAASIVAIT
jgi:hypothetical protein